MSGTIPNAAAAAAVGRVLILAVLMLDLARAMAMALLLLLLRKAVMVKMGMVAAVVKEVVAVVWNFLRPYHCRRCRHLDQKIRPHQHHRRHERLAHQTQR